MICYGWGMTKIWFTSDQHFGHAGILTYCSRPFADVQAMDTAMVQQWNDRVGPMDEVWCLGDFCAGRDAGHYARHLNGRKHLVVGNHDRHARKWQGWASIHDYHEMSVAGRRVVLFHYPMRVWNASHYGSIHLYGHMHNALPPTAQSCDVGVDAWSFAPVGFDQITHRMAQAT